VGWQGGPRNPEGHLALLKLLAEMTKHEREMAKEASMSATLFFDIRISSATP
jgi:hypothetical protein